MCGEAVCQTANCINVELLYVADDFLNLLAGKVVCQTARLVVIVNDVSTLLAHYQSFAAQN